LFSLLVCRPLFDWESLIRFYWFFCKEADPLQFNWINEYPITYKCKGIFVFLHFLRQKYPYTTTNWTGEDPNTFYKACTDLVYEKEKEKNKKQKKGGKKNHLILGPTQ